MKRRTFLTVVGSGAAGVTLGSLGLSRLLPARRSPHRHRPLSERWTTSVCGGCHAACSVQIRLSGNHLVGIRGNPCCPLSRGGLCARGAAEVEAFYDPDRLLGPVQRAGKRGAGEWRRITWRSALAQLSERLSALRRGGKSGRVGVVLGPQGGVTEAVVRQFLAAYGSVHLYRINPLRDEACVGAADLTQGSGIPWTYDLARTGYLLSFGTPVLEGWLSPAWVAAMFGNGRGRKRDRLRFVQVESRLSPTAMRADEWVPVRPGTETLLALGIACALVNEGRFDRGFVERYTLGFEAAASTTGGAVPSFADLLGDRYPPSVVSKMTGVPLVTILRLAREFATASAPLAVGERLAGSTGVQGLAAVQALNALRGRLGAPGGVLGHASVPVTPLPSFDADEPARRARTTRRLVDPPDLALRGASLWRVLAANAKVHTRSEPPFDVLILEDGAVLSGLSRGDPALQALARTPLIVSLATGLDASTHAADLVLPATTRFEQWNDVEPPPTTGGAILALSRPALPHLVEGKGVAQLFLELARKLGAPMTRALPFRDIPAVIRHRLAGVFRARYGMPYGSPFQREWMAQMAHGGWWTAAAASEREFFKLVLDRGGWLDPVTERAPAGGTQRYRFHGAVGPKPRSANQALFFAQESVEAWSPRPEPPPAKVAEGHFWLIPFSVGSLQGAGTPNRPSLLQTAGPHVEGAFRPWAELNPVDADRLGVKDLALVEVTSETGGAVLSVRRYPGIPPGAVAVAMGPAGVGAGRWARGWHEGAARLLGPVRGSWIGCALSAGTSVRIKPVKGGTA